MLAKIYSLAWLIVAGLVTNICHSDEVTGIHSHNDDVICSGCARPVPASVIELVKAANRSLKLGQLLCQCRSPDFLLEVIEKQVQCVSY